MKRLALVLTIAAVALCVMLPAVAQDAPTGPAPVGIRPDAPPYAVHGPYWVGTRDFVIDDGAGIPLPVTVWYPALNPEGLPETITYAAPAKLPLAEWGLPPDLAFQVSGHALLDAEPDPAAGPAPLIVFSHGFGTNRQSNAYLTEHLASYGFVVIAPDHEEIWTPDLVDIGPSTFERPVDTQRTIAFAETLAADGVLAGLIDMERIGTAGFSYGGDTALRAAGAAFDTALLTESCQQAPEGSDFAINLCANILPRLDEFAALLGYDETPQGAWESWADPRVQAVVTLAASPVVAHADLTAVTAPVLALAGTLDTNGEAHSAAQAIYSGVGSDQRAMLTFANADHYISNWSCADAPLLVDLGFGVVCSDPVWDLNRTHDLINHFTTAFLLDTLTGDAEAHAALAPDAVAFPGITYAAEGF